MDPVETHLARVLAAIRPVEPARLGLEAAEGAVLAEDAAALTPLPSFDNSSMDGYAVHAVDIAAATAEAPVILPVTDQVPAARPSIRTAGRSMPPPGRMRWSCSSANTPSI